MQNKFIFDVDGTLTPSRGQIDPKFSEWFELFCYTNDVYLVTGSDRPKTIEQLGESLYNACQRVYNCTGNDVWEKDINLERNEWILPSVPHIWLSEQLSASEFPLRTGLHFEHRPGMVNFSVVGRNANKEERNQYIDWDEEHNERNTIAQKFNLIFTELDARPGGETGIDIAPKGCDKSQILKDFVDDDYIYFFGDRCDANGNDYPLAKAIEGRGESFNVSDWTDTWNILKKLS
jgi:phosphomannomutase